MDLHPNPSLNIPNPTDMGEEYCYLCWLVVASEQCHVFRWFYFKPQKEICNEMKMCYSHNIAATENDKSAD
jgi:hypothetical protein